MSASLPTSDQPLRTATAATLTVLCLLSALAVPSRAEVPVATLAAAFAGQSNFGTIKGKLVWGGPEAPATRTLVEKGQASKDPAVCAVDKSLVNNDLPVDPKTKGVKFAFAYLPKPKGVNPEAVAALVKSAPSVEIDQKLCEFLPYATAIHQDQTLVFKSSDPVGHNVHLSPFSNAAFNTSISPNGQIEKKFVAERRVIPLACDIHPWMKGWIMVFDHPFFAITSTDGSFEIKGVPPGEQNLVIWQAAVGYATPGLAKGMPVTVKAGQTIDVGDVKLDPAKVKLTP